jgi:hypothetical protein
VADDRIDVVFGARVGELIAGVHEAKEAIPKDCGHQPMRLPLVSGASPRRAASRPRRQPDLKRGENG